MEQYYMLDFSEWPFRISYIFNALAHSLYTRNTLDSQDTEDWKYYYNLRFKQIQQRIPAQDQYWCKYFRNKCIGRNMKYHWTEWGSDPRRFRRQRLALKNQET